MRVRLFSDIGHVMPKIDWEGMCILKTCVLKYDVVATAGPVTNTYTLN